MTRQHCGGNTCGVGVRLMLLAWAVGVSSAAAAELKWHTALPEARTAARRSGTPLLVRVGSESCPYCRVLEQTMAEEAVAAALEKWTLVDLRLETAGDELAPLGVGPIPALRALTPLGTLAAEHDGALPAEELLQWLRAAANAVAGSTETDALLLEEGEVDGALAVRLAALFDRRDAAVREAALRRLQPQVAVAAAPVVLAFREGSLATQLTALDLLEAWRAPVAGLDPWRPETVTSARLEALAEWAAARAAAADAPDTPAAGGPDRRSLRELLDRYLAAPEAEAHAIRERLARFGRLALPQVYEALQRTDDDRARAALTHLRYRLVATDRLALTWNGGLERLADPDVEVRQRALEDLAARAGAADQPLLLELFSDPAPLIRETALLALHRVGAHDVSGALLRLLDDPDPNVQAAVLKQLAEAPSAEVVPRVAAYVSAQTNADLVGHAVRVLGAAAGQPAIEALTGLLAHDDWHVRAAAVEALAQKAQRRQGDETAADIYVAILGKLQDEDGFVVGRAAQAFAGADLPIAVEPLVQAARVHPELTATVIAALTSGQNSREKALPHLRQFCQHGDAAARAAAITGLTRAAGDGAQDELRAALQDAAAAPRVAAATALEEFLRQHLGNRPSTASSYQPPRTVEAAVSALAVANADGETVDDDADRPRRDPEDYLRDIRAGRRLPRWTFAFASLLEPLLQAEAAEERLAAAVALAALGRDEAAVPVLRREAAAQPSLQAARALPWLRWSDRAALFQQLTQSVRDVDVLEGVVENLTLARDARSAELMWPLLRRPESDARWAQALQQLFRQLYLDSPYPRSPDKITTQQRRFIQQDVPLHAKADAARWERWLALALLLELEPAAAVETAAALSAAPLPATERAGLLQVQLLGSSESAATRLAVAALESDALEVRGAAARFLALGSDGVCEFEGLSLRSRVGVLVGGGGEQIDLSAPDGLRAAAVRPLLDAPDALTALCARYLLVLLGDTEALTGVLERWRQLSQPDEETTRLTYRAIAAANDPRGLPVLSAIYQQLRLQGGLLRTRDFYWTVRQMTGDEALQLRRQIREEIGMENLR